MIAVCLHGFLRSGASMFFLSQSLRSLGYKKIIFPTFAYHWTPLSIIAERLHREIERQLQEHSATQVDVITYSMGALIFRASLEYDIPYRRALMIAPPNQGAQMASQMRKWLPVHNMGWDPFGPLLPEFAQQLKEPPSSIEVGILAGIKGNQKGYNRFLSSDNDGKVRLEETMLSRDVPLHVVEARHPMMILHPRNIQIAKYFLEHGMFPTT